MTSYLPLMGRTKNEDRKSESHRKTTRGLPFETAFDELINETVLLFHRLRIVADEVHHQGEMTGGLRSILRSLDKGGAQTVPEMARVRSVSRQHVQMLVNQLAEAGFVEFIENPAHKRSPLVQLTSLGKKTVDAMNRREQKLLGKSGLGAPEKKLREAAETLRTVRAYFESDIWKRLLKTLK
jgi:DNA-binding MarR family transcriptional regulator